MKTKILLSVMTLLFAAVQINAQAHDNSKGGCRLAKNHVSTGYICPACEAIDKKEAEARKADDKKRIAASVAKGQADKLAANAAHKKKMAEMAAKNKVTEVKVVMPKASLSNTKKPNKVEMVDREKYRIENESEKLKNVNPSKAYNSKIYYDDKLVYDSNLYTKIHLANRLEGKIVFEAIYPLPDTECGRGSLPTYNHKILLDKNFKKINFEGIDRYFQANIDGDESFIWVTREKCEKNNPSSTLYWEYGTKYIFDSKTNAILKSEPLNIRMCNCDE